MRLTIKTHSPDRPEIEQRDMMRRQVSITPSKEFDSRHEWVDVEKERMRTETEVHALPKDVPDFVTDVPKTTQSEMKDIFDVNTERNIF